MSRSDKQSELVPPSPSEAEDPRGRPDPEGPVTVGELIEGAKKMFGDVSVAARRLADRGRYRKVRVSRKGKALLPDIPFAAVAALEAASFMGGGIGRALALNVGAKLFFDIDVINEADKFFERGKEALLDGDLDAAEEALLRAVSIDDLHPGAFLQLGVLYRLKGNAGRARVCVARAKELDPAGEIGKRADAIRAGLDAEG